jgi:hypothetical protein
VRTCVASECYILETPDRSALPHPPTRRSSKSNWIFIPPRSYLFYFSKNKITTLLLPRTFLENNHRHPSRPIKRGGKGVLLYIFHNSTPADNSAAPRQHSPLNREQYGSREKRSSTLALLCNCQHETKRFHIGRRSPTLEFYFDALIAILFSRIWRQRSSVYYFPKQYSNQNIDGLHVALSHVAHSHVALSHVAHSHVALSHVAHSHVALSHVALSHVALSHVALSHVALSHVAHTRVIFVSCPLPWRASHHVTSHHVTSHHFTSHHFTSHHVAHFASLHITSRHITSLHFTSRRLNALLYIILANNIVIGYGDAHFTSILHVTTRTQIWCLCRDSTLEGITSTLFCILFSKIIR